MRRFCVFALALFVFGCSSHEVMPSATQGIQPGVKQKQPLDMGWVVTKLRREDWAIAPATDEKQMYFLNKDEPQLESLSMSLHLTASPCALGGTGAGHSLAYGPDHNLWVGGYQIVARCTPAGQETDYSIGDWPNGIVTGPDGAMWFTMPYTCQVGRIDMTGTFTSYPLVCEGNSLGQIVSGPDGNLWLADGLQILQVTTAGIVTAFDTVSSCGAYYLTNGPEGDLYFSDDGLKFGQITTSGQITCFDTPESGAAVGMMSFGPGGSLWLSIGQTGVQIYYPSTNSFGPLISLPMTDGEQQIVSGMARGPDNNLWVMGVPTHITTGYVLVYARLTMTVTPGNLTITPGTNGTLTVSERVYKGSWKAASSAKSVATVSEASSNSFTVTGVAPGKCTITISDGQKNFVPVTVTVQ